MTTQQQHRPHEHDLPLLGAVAGFLHWLESLAIIVSGPLLTIGLGIALVALLTDGQLLTTAPWLLYAWAIAQAVGVDAQLMGASFRMVRAARNGHPWAAVGYGALVVVLGYVAYVAAAVFAEQEASGITTAQALGVFGMDSSTWLLQRVGISVVLVVLSGALRYVPPAKVKVSAEHERAELERELELEPLRQRLRAQKAVGGVALARQALSAVTGRERETLETEVLPAPKVASGAALPQDDKPPTGPGSPSAVPVEPPTAGGTHPTPKRARRDVIRLVEDKPRKPRTAAASGRANGGSAKPVRTPRDSAEAERAARAAWVPGMSVGELQAAAQISRNAASKHRRILIAEANGVPLEGRANDAQAAL